MSSPTLSRRSLHRLGLAGVGSAVLLVAIASPAGAATDVVVPIEPTEVLIGAFAVGDLSGMNPMADPSTVPTPAPVAVEFDGALTVDLPAEFDDSTVGAELVFDDNQDGTPEATYSSSFTPANPNRLTVTGQGTGSITVDLPGDDPLVGDAATLVLQPLDSALGPAFTSFGGLSFELAFEAPADPLAPATVTVEPVLVAVSQVPCELTAGQRCPFPDPVIVGSAVTLDLTADSPLRELGLDSLTGAQVGLAQLGEDGFPTSDAPLELEVEVAADGQTASVVVPADTAPGAYSLIVVQPTLSGGISVFQVEITVVAEEVPAVVPPPAIETVAPAPQAVAVNAGLRSNTGVEAVDTGSTGSVAVAAGAGMLVLAGAGGVAVARTRRRPAAEGGPCA